MAQPTKKELFIKSIAYRIIVILYEAGLGALVAWLGFNIFEFVVINNMIKLIGYFVIELIWFGYLRTRYQILERWILNRIRENRQFFLLSIIGIITIAVIIAILIVSL